MALCSTVVPLIYGYRCHFGDLLHYITELVAIGCPEFSQQQCQHSMTTVMISDRDSNTLYRLYKEAAARARAGLSEGNGAMSGTQATVYLLY